jgi:hypothetical protein
MLQPVGDSLNSVSPVAVYAMVSPVRRQLGLIVAWFVFPLVPVVLEDFHYQCSNFAGPDPREWGWFMWVLMLGPLLGFGFLAGATVDLPDDVGPPRRGWRRLAARRSVWVAFGPWCGYLPLFAGFYAFGYLVSQFPARPNRGPDEPAYWQGTWIESVLAWIAWALGWALLVSLTVMWSYGWLWPASAALKRAARIGRFQRAFYRGLAVSLTFVGSLFGGFWAATALWRSYFFDPRIVPLLIMAVGLAVTSGCGNTITYGEVRRRELFHAMLVAWVLGLAVMWRWWARRRPGPPDGRA